MTSTELATTGRDQAAAEVAWFEATQRQATLLANSGIVPKAYKGKPDEIVVAAMYGRDFGWSPMQAMNSIVVLDGRPSLNAQAMVGLVRQYGHSIDGSASPTEATVIGTRADTGDSITFTFSVWDAARAGLCSVDDAGVTRARSQNGKRLPWEMYPQSMCWARAVSQVCRMLFADIVAGVSYTPEENQSIDVPSVDVTGQLPASAREVERERSTKERRDYLRTEIDRLNPNHHEAWQAWKAEQPDDEWPFWEDTLRAGIAEVYRLLQAQGEEPFDVTDAPPVVDDDGHDEDTASQVPPTAAAVFSSPADPDTEIVDGELIEDGEPF